MKNLFNIFLILGCCFWVTKTDGQDLMFIKFENPDLEGKTTAQGMNGWSDVSEVSYEVVAGRSTGSGRSINSGNPAMKFTVKKKKDGAFSKLGSLSKLNGRIFQKVKIAYVASGSAEPHKQIILENCIIKKGRQSGNSELLELSFQRILFFDEADALFGWDVTQGRKI